MTLKKGYAEPFNKSNLARKKIRFWNERKTKSIKSLGAIFAGGCIKKKRALSVELRLTSKCNNRCRYCNSFNLNKEELSKEEIFKIVDSVKDQCIHLVLTGGEPLLRKDIKEIVDYIRKCEKHHTIFQTMVTNGRLVKKRINDILNLDALILSFDGPEEVHDKVRGKGSFKSVMGAMEVARQNNLKVWTITVLTKHNLQYIDYILQKAKELDFYAYFQPVFEYDLSSHDLRGIMPDKKEYREAIRTLINNYGKCGKYIVNSMNGLRYLSHYPIPKAKMKCQAGKFYCLVDFNGDVYPCWGMIGRMKPLNIRTSSFEEAFNNANVSKCNGCWGAANIELNYAFSRSMTTSMHLLRMVIEDALKRRYGE